MHTDTVVPVAFFVFLAYVIVGVTRAVSDGATRRQLLRANASPELARALTAAPLAELALQGALRSGLVIGSIGLALVVVQFMPYGPDQPIVYGTVLLFGAAGLLGYYALGRRTARRAGSAAPV